jgi:hypothetical protein
MTPKWTVTIAIESGNGMECLAKRPCVCVYSVYMSHCSEWKISVRPNPNFFWYVVCVYTEPFLEADCDVLWYARSYVGDGRGRVTRMVWRARGLERYFSVLT